MTKFKDAKLEFPREWEFRVIIAEAARPAAEEGIAKLLSGRSVAVSQGERSRNGSYGTTVLRMEVGSQEDLDTLSLELQKVPGVKFLL